MEAEADNQRGVDEYLRPTRCGNCGYRLKGLPEEGKCPECGFVYSPKRVVVFGWGSGKKGKLTNVHGRRLFWKLLGTCPLAAVAIQLFYGWTGPLVVTLVFWAALIAWLIYRRRENMAGELPPTQVRLFPEGFAQRDGVGEVELMRWEAKYTLILSEASLGRYQLRLVVTKWEHEFETPLSIEFDCDRPTAQRLREHIDRCRQQSAHTAETDPPA